MFYYVYGLIDPSTDELFYIGKGCGDRWRHHFLETDDTRSNARKGRRIAAIKESGRFPKVMFFEKDMSEDDALLLETFLICLFGRRDIDRNGVLTNLALNVNAPGGVHEIATEARAALPFDIARIPKDERASFCQRITSALLTD